MLTLEAIAIRQGDFSLRADVKFTTGEVSALIGPSGAGKSTILSVIAGFQEIASGAILWNGQRIDQKAPSERPVAILFQDNNLFPHLTVAQNAGLGIRPSLRLTAAERSRISETLESVGLGGMEHRKPASLSGGQQSRAALARILLQDRPVVLLDEPFAALGPGLKAEMLSLVRDRLCSETRTVVMVTHDPRDADEIADRIVLVDDGIVHPARLTSEVLAEPPEVLRRYLGTL